jgi:prepilin-type N-terminal cleavage/methylation domain-containing protein
MPKTRLCLKQGFTLIEISIVLVVIGLLAAGILVGQDLIEAARLRRVVTDAEEFKLGISTFRLKYNALPGDMSNAEEIWGSDDLCPDNSSTPDAPKIPTCNGNGDGLIRNMTNDTEDYEVFRAIQQLSNAGMIGGTYTGISGPTYRYYTITGLNIPKLSTFDAGMLAVHNDTTLSGDHLYRAAYRLMIHIGMDTNGGWNFKGFLTPQQAYNIDKKSDDGTPAGGIWRTYKPGSYPDPFPPHCATSNLEEEAEYDLSHTQVKCGLVYVIQRD